FENGELLLDAAVEFAVVLVAAAGRQDHAVRKLLEKRGDRLRPFTGVIQKIQTEFEEAFAGLGLAPGVLEQGWDVWHAERNAEAGEWRRLGHRKKDQLRMTRGGGGTDRLAAPLGQLGGRRGGEPV